MYSVSGIHLALSFHTIFPKESVLVVSVIKLTNLYLLSNYIVNQFVPSVTIVTDPLLADITLVAAPSITFGPVGVIVTLFVAALFPLSLMTSVKLYPPETEDNKGSPTPTAPDPLPDSKYNILCVDVGTVTVVDAEIVLW